MSTVSFPRGVLISVNPCCSVSTYVPCQQIFSSHQFFFGNVLVERSAREFPSSEYNSWSTRGDLLQGPCALFDQFPTKLRPTLTGKKSIVRLPVAFQQIIYDSIDLSEYSCLRPCFDILKTIAEVHSGLKTAWETLASVDQKGLLHITFIDHSICLTKAYFSFV